jgi:hypothetical protein
MIINLTCPFEYLLDLIDDLRVIFVLLRQCEDLHNQFRGVKFPVI